MTKILGFTEKYKGLITLIGIFVTLIVVVIGSSRASGKQEEMILSMKDNLKETQTYVQQLTRVSIEVGDLIKKHDERIEEHQREIVRMNKLHKLAPCSYDNEGK